MRFLTAALVAAFFASPVSAQPFCATYDEISNFLAKKYQEHPIGRGIAGQAVLEVWAGPDGTFTVLMVTADGNACAMMDGEGWETVEAKETSF